MRRIIPDRGRYSPRRGPKLPNAVLPSDLQDRYRLEFHLALWKHTEWLCSKWLQLNALATRTPEEEKCLQRTDAAIQREILRDPDRWANLPQVCTSPAAVVEAVRKEAIREQAALVAELARLEKGGCS